MVTLHATAKRQGNGFIAMVTIRYPDGTMRGSVVNPNRKPVFSAVYAKAQASIAARMVASRNPHVIVKV
jgi:hypothetical protein